MKKIFKIFVIVIITLVVLSLTLSPIFAQENLQTPNKDVANKVDELVELKDNSTLSDQDKEIKEIQIRKEALGEITNLSLLETKNLENKINSLDLKSDDQNKIKTVFLEILNNNKTYSEDLKSKIEKDELTLDEVKNLAQEYKNWREENYNKYVKKITVFILTFQEKQVLKTANVRLEKIMTDLKKLENVKILKKEDTSNLINSAIKSLANSQIFNSNAEKIIINAIKTDILDIATSTPISVATSASATSTPRFAEGSDKASSEPENATTTPEKVEKITEPIQQTKDGPSDAPSSAPQSGATAGKQDKPIKESATASTTALTAPLSGATSTPKIISEEDSAQTLIEKSLQEIKNAYNNFISISNKVSRKLKLK